MRALPVSDVLGRLPTVADGGRARSRWRLQPNCSLSRVASRWGLVRWAGLRCACMLGCDLVAIGGFLDGPGDHQELADGPQDRVARPVHDVEAVPAGECPVLLARVPAEA